MKYIYSYQENGISKAFQERNIYLAKMLAKCLDGEYRGEYKPSSHDNEVVILPSNIISENTEMGRIIKDHSQIYGAVGDFNMSLKTLVHDPIDTTRRKSEFANFLDSLSVKPPGYACYSVQDIYDATYALAKKDIDARIKLALGSGLYNQLPLNNSEISIEEIEKWILDRTSHDDLAKYGAVVEQNYKLFDTPKISPCLSTGQIITDGKRYTYSGWQKLDNQGYYRGTVLHMTEGGNHEEIPGFDISNIKFAQIADKITQYIEENLVKFAGRINLNYILADINDEPKLIFNEQTLRPGGASAAEIAAIKYLRHNKDESSVGAETLYKYISDKSTSQLDEKNYIKIWSGSDNKVPLNSMWYRLLI